MTVSAHGEGCTGVLVPAGGRGERAGGGDYKQFRPIRGVPMLLRALRPFIESPAIAEIVVALPGRVASAPPSWLAHVLGDRVRAVSGGETRAESVRAALAALSPRCEFVLVHDAARPFVSTETVRAVMQKARDGVGVLAATPVTDTVKRVADDMRVIETVERVRLWRAHTPQGFPRAMLEQAFATAEQSGQLRTTDDSALVEAAGFPVCVVPDASTNVKITTPEDFVLAEALAAR